MPVIRVQDRAEGLPPGTVVQAIGTDPGILNDVPAWSQVHGHQVLETRSAGHEYTVVIRLGEG
jgi:TusA-related sulfurtransferase